MSKGFTVRFAESDKNLNVSRPIGKLSDAGRKPQKTRFILQP
jgi:hypothetical protein